MYQQRRLSTSLTRLARSPKLTNQSGQGLVEYMILLALVVLVCVGSTKLLGLKLNRRFTEIKNSIEESVPVKVQP